MVEYLLWMTQFRFLVNLCLWENCGATFYSSTGGSDSNAVFLLSARYRPTEGKRRIPPLQAQTVANFYLAFEQNLTIIPVLNKCDMTNAEPEKVADQMQQVTSTR